MIAGWLVTAPTAPVAPPADERGERPDDEVDDADQVDIGQVPIVVHSDTEGGSEASEQESRLFASRKQP